MTSWLGGRKGPAAALTLLILILIVLIPALVLLDLIAVQAYQLTQEAVPWLEKSLENPEDLSIPIPDWVPFRDKIDSSGPQIAAKLGELAGMVGASRERVNKAIASFIRLGWLEQQDRSYTIIQRDRLELRAR